MTNRWIDEESSGGPFSVSEVYLKGVLERPTSGNVTLNRFRIGTVKGVEVRTL